MSKAFQKKKIKKKSVCDYYLDKVKNAEAGRSQEWLRSYVIVASAGARKWERKMEWEKWQIWFCRHWA